MLCKCYVICLLLKKKTCSNTNMNENKPETDLRPCHISKPDLFTKIVNGLSSLTVFVEIFVLDV